MIKHVQTHDDHNHFGPPMLQIYVKDRHAILDRPCVGLLWVPVVLSIHCASQHKDVAGPPTQPRKQQNKLDKSRFKATGS